MCSQCEQAARRASQYPIWSIRCDACNRRALSWYPEGTMQRMNMAVLIGVKRGFDYVRRLEQDMRDGVEVGNA